MTKNLEQLSALSNIAGRDWLIMQSSIPRLACQLMQAPKPSEALDVSMEDFFEMRKPLAMDQDGIAYVQIHSALVDSCPPIHEKIGAVTRYSTIKSEIQTAIEAGAKGIILVSNSPGGTVSGCVETADFISNLSIPVVAFAEGMACSAAYKLISGADAIVASPSAQVGNIGTILSWANMEAFWASMGVTFEAITSEGADLKSTFHTEPNESQREFLQDGINRAGEDFRNHVIAGRTAAGAVLDDEIWRAGWYSGEQAGVLGLVDEIGSIEVAKMLIMDQFDPEIDPEEEPEITP